MSSSSQYEVMGIVSKVERVEDEYSFFVVYRVLIKGSELAVMNTRQLRRSP
jgi:hypothetical protein